MTREVYREHGAGSVVRGDTSEAERAVLGSCLIDRDAIAVVAPLLVPEDFADPRHRVMYEAMLQLWGQRTPIDLITFGDRLRQLPEYREVESPETYAGELILATPTSVHVEHYARIIKTHALQRQLDLAYQCARRDEMEAILAEMRRLEHGAAHRFQLLTPSELSVLPDPEYLIEKMIVADSLAEIYGDAGTYKTFVALSMGLSIASGIAWNGRRVTSGPVVYVISEGARGFKKRIRAWEIYHGRPAPETFYVLPDTVRVLDSGDVEAFRQTLAQLPVPPVLVVLDTLSRALDGGDENAPTDMGRAIGAMDRIRTATGGGCADDPPCDEGGQVVTRPFVAPRGDADGD